jgi:hypothetical protein
MRTQTTKAATFLTAEPEPAALAVARRVAGYYIGDSSWADLLIDAYLNPERALTDLHRRMDDRG